MPLPTSASSFSRETWDVFCRVVDNHGDVGVCWRLSAELAARGVAVRLWIDDARALNWMAAGGRSGVDVMPWPVTDADLSTVRAKPADIVVETFGCGLPEPYLGLMAEAPQQRSASVWINLEYLSAEAYVERSHRLPSLQGSGPGQGLTRWFFYPGFTPACGGLLREVGLMQEQAVFDRRAWLTSLDLGPDLGGNERLVSLFCYANAGLAGMLRALVSRPTLLLTTPGFATDQVAQVLVAEGSTDGTLGQLRTRPIPWLGQTDYDRLLWSCDLNFVRGEDSLVRAIWAGRPFVWQIYPQDDAAHAPKLGAFLARQWARSSPQQSGPVCDAFWHWNDLASSSHSPTVAVSAPWRVLDSATSMADWAARCVSWRAELLGQPDLITQLLAFAASTRQAEDAKM
ncbi:MAG: elongation factor P maturation arginine rhamnosyltransferase EarP [Burkholderiaceae bacterium]|nr:elongation factor P maturation arginine rhamnosyltransferase EarP [Burkholderiaceae bacterium]